LIIDAKLIFIRAMLARYMPSSCVRLSFCPTSVFY